MPDDDWARGKCAMKALLYMSQEIPTVCSAVGANLEVISHGQNGFLASSAHDWIESIGELIKSAELRRKLGKAGRETVEARYSMRRSASLFADVVYETLGESRKREELNQWEPRKSRNNVR
jgi:glycosyltransferase involved in cell wall biosynthesis